MGRAQQSFGPISGSLVSGGDPWCRPTAGRGGLTPAVAPTAGPERDSSPGPVPRLFRRADGDRIAGFSCADLMSGARPIGAVA